MHSFFYENKVYKNV